MTNASVRSSATPGDLDEVAVHRFAQALRQAMVVHGYSERRLATELGITIGTTQKYFRGKVHPLKVATGISQKLSDLLGVTLDALVRYYESGDYESGVTFSEVVSWVRSSAGMEHITPMLEAMSIAGRRTTAGESSPVEDAPPPPYTWPIEELRNVGMSDALRERMGLGDEALRRLAEQGEYDDALVEAFSVAVNIAEDEVRKAFSGRCPIPQP